MLRQLGAKPVSTDMIAFYREAQRAPARRMNTRDPCTVRSWNFAPERPSEWKSFTPSSWMKQVAREARQKEHVLGLVPTMGALHEGHISLIREAQRQCSPVAVSIFVNPKQFGPSEDFKKYPRTFEADRDALEKLGVNYLFAPPPEEIYPKDFRTAVIVEGLSDRLEGKSRPGHFRGVTTVVLKLFEIVQPRFAFFGRKDAQQVRSSSSMVRDLNLDVEIVVCPIVREAGRSGAFLAQRLSERRRPPSGHRCCTVRSRLPGTKFAPESAIQWHSWPSCAA